MTSTLLVTGATGLIGRELMASLPQGSWQVHTASRSVSVGHHCCDLSRPDEAFALVDEVRPAAVVHLAGGTSPSRHALYESNVLATVNLMNAVGRMPSPSYFIVACSAAEYGDASEAPICEA